MQYFLSLLPVLACPIGMGLMIGFMLQEGGGSVTARPARTELPGRECHSYLMKVVGYE